MIPSWDRYFGLLECSDTVGLEEHVARKTHASYSKGQSGLDTGTNRPTAYAE